jgi:GNAT superfamily N-acetyltransferase
MKVPVSNEDRKKSYFKYYEEDVYAGPSEKYDMIKDYKEDEFYRQSLNSLTKNTFGFDFEDWYLQGYWTDRYRPYSLLHNNKVVANVSVNPIDFLINGNLNSTLQIGTVMTDKTYRHKGLSRILMEQVLMEYEGTCSLIYLYANSTAVHFYPKFGFTEAAEYYYCKNIAETSEKTSCRQLNLQNSSDKELINRLTANTVPVSKYSMIENPGLLMFYLTSYLSGSIYYLEEFELAAVVEYEGDIMILQDVFCEHSYPLDKVISSLNNNNSKKAVLGFTPNNTDGFVCEKLQDADNTFYIKGKYLTEKGRFPVLSHA